MQAKVAMTTADNDKRRAILNATLDLVAERGFHNAPVSQVAKRSGVSTGIIYHYFANKDDLIHALYRHIKAEYGAALMAGEPQHQPWPDHLLRMWRNAYNFYITHPQATAFIEQFENSPFYENWYAEGVFDDDNMRTLAQLIEGDIERGVLRPLPLEVLYELTLGVAVGIAKRHLSGSINADEALLELVASACRRAVEA